MRPSALQLKSYMVTEVNVAANREFDAKRRVNLGLQNVLVEADCRPEEGNCREWQIVLRVKDSQSADSNSPYSFRIELVGFFAVSESVSEKTLDGFARVNGSSVLYSTAREVLRSLMSMGPYRPILLPAVCFFDPKHVIEGAAVGETAELKTSPADIAVGAEVDADAAGKGKKARGGRVQYTG